MSFSASNLASLSRSLTARLAITRSYQPRDEENTNEFDSQTADALLATQSVLDGIDRKMAQRLNADQSWGILTWLSTLAAIGTTSYVIKRKLYQQ